MQSSDHSGDSVIRGGGGGGRVNPSGQAPLAPSSVSGLSTSAQLAPHPSATQPSAAQEAVSVGQLPFSTHDETGLLHERLRGVSDFAYFCAQAPSRSTLMVDSPLFVVDGKWDSLTRSDPVPFVRNVYSSLVPLGKVARPRTYKNKISLPLDKTSMPIDGNQLPFEIQDNRLFSTWFAVIFT